MSGARVLAAAGLWGAVLTAVILAMSVLLRLGTRIDGGEAVSVLPLDIEQWARIAHRAAAMAVGILAALALVAVARERPVPRARMAPVACVAALTVLLSIIGRYTPGYRNDLVTVLNVAGGVALVAAFWWLRESTHAPCGRDSLAATALALLLALAALGSAADAAALRGERAFVPLHLWLATVFAGVTLAAAWRQRHRRVVASAVATLTAAQLALGFALAGGADVRSMAAAWAHAMIALALAVLLAKLAVSRPVALPAAGGRSGRCFGA